MRTTTKVYTNKEGKRALLKIFEDAPYLVFIDSKCVLMAITLESAEECLNKNGYTKKTRIKNVDNNARCCNQN
jgi:hypothetical protein